MIGRVQIVSFIMDNVSQHVSAALDLMTKDAKLVFRTPIETTMVFVYAIIDGILWRIVVSIMDHVSKTAQT